MIWPKIMTVIAVISPKGGVGKTTVSANLAVSLAAKGHPVRLVDMDPQNALRLHLGADPSDENGHIHQTLHGYLEKRSRLFRCHKFFSFQRTNYFLIVR